MRLSHMMQKLGNWKWLLNAVIRKASRSEEVADAISSMFDDLEEREKRVSPLFYLQVLFAGAAHSDGRRYVVVCVF